MLFLQYYLVTLQSKNNNVMSVHTKRQPIKIIIQDAD